MEKRKTVKGQKCINCNRLLKIGSSFICLRYFKKLQLIICLDNDPPFEVERLIKCAVKGGADWIYKS